jgi:hypothetical protein
MTTYIFIFVVVLLVFFWWNVLTNSRLSKSEISTLGIGALAWLGVSGAMALTGFAAKLDTFPPRPVFFLVPLFGIFWWLLRHEGLKKAFGDLPITWFVWIQAMRILVEIGLFQLYGMGKIPMSMTFEGWNFDILVGILAIPVGYLLQQNAAKYRIWGIAFNIYGIISVLIVAITGGLSLPQFSIFYGTPNQAVLEYPYVWLPAFIVPSALLFHIFSLRQHDFFK